MGWRGTEGRIFFFLKKKEAKKTSYACAGASHRGTHGADRWIASLRSQ
jgi:hypothetical protein